MKKYQWLFPGILLLVVMMHSVNARAQYGCGQQPITELFNCSPCGSTDETTETCGPGGDPLNFCYQGYGLCCGIEFQTANTIIDYFDCKPGTKSYFMSALPPANQSHRPRVVLAVNCVGRVSPPQNAPLPTAPAHDQLVVIRDRLRWD